MSQADWHQIDGPVQVETKRFSYSVTRLEIYSGRPSLCRILELRGEGVSLIAKSSAREE